MADEDLVAIVSYLRTMDPVENNVHPPDWTFMGKVVHLIAPTFKPVENPTPADASPPMRPTIERGEYLARYVANCVTCHTKRDPMTFEATGPEFAGGMEFEPLPELHKELGVDPELWSRSPNLTPHLASALSKFPPWKTGSAASGWEGLFHIPPWGPFSRMSDEDLEALYLYLHSLDPVENDVGLTVFKKDS